MNLAWTHYTVQTQTLVHCTTCVAMIPDTCETVASHDVYDVYQT